jgi:hypothetical protein
MKWFAKLSVGSALALVGVVALIGGAVSLAVRDNSQAATKRSAASSNNNNRSGPPWLRGNRSGRPSAKDFVERRKKFQSELADELGVSQEKVATAFRNLLEKHLNEAVQNGDLTDKQRDRILQCYDNPDKCEGGPFGFHGGGPPMGGPGRFGPPGGGPGFGPPM